MTDKLDKLKECLISKYNEAVRLHNNLDDEIFFQSKRDLQIKVITLRDVLDEIENTRKG